MGMDRNLNPDSCMEAGRTRTLQRYQSYGKDRVKPVAASWKNSSSGPKTNTMRPVLVDDFKYRDPQHLRPSEAEALLGWDHGCPAAPSVTDKQRLKIIGKG